MTRPDLAPRSLLGRLPWLLVLLLGVAATGCRNERAPAAPTAESAAQAAPVKVELARAGLEKWRRTIRVQGSLLADEQAVVGAKVAGRVKRVGKDGRLDLGSIVEQGESLVILDTEDLDLRVRQAEAQINQALAKLGVKPGTSEQSLDATRVPAVLEAEAVRNQARHNLERAETLSHDKVIAVEDFQERQAAKDVAEAKYFSALNDVQEQLAIVRVRRAELDLAKQVRADSEVRAPFAGTIQERHVAPGAYLQVGEPVVTLVRIHPLRFHAAVPERETLAVSEGQESRIVVEGHPTPIVEKIRRISPAVETNNRTLAIEVDVPNPDRRLRAGLFAEADVVIDPEAQTLAVPAEAVWEFAGVEKVWLVRNGEAREQIVQTGRREPKRVEILKGLSAGNTVIADAKKGRRGPVVEEKHK